MASADKAIKACQTSLQVSIFIGKHILMDGPQEIFEHTSMNNEWFAGSSVCLDVCTQKNLQNIDIVTLGTCMGL